MKTTEVQTYFPSGLHQPERGYRFSVDALLLAEFAAELAPAPGSTVADLGTGCGVVAFGLALRCPGLILRGIERNAAMAEAVRRNAELLGINSYQLIQGDVAEPEILHRARLSLPLCHEHPPLFDMVVCNPPWRTPGAGRPSPSQDRNDAQIANPETLQNFLRAADALLKNHAPLVLIYAVERLPQVLSCLPSRLHPQRLRFVYSPKNGNAIFFLLEARKNSRAALVIDAPFYLNHQASHKTTD